MQLSVEQICKEIAEETKSKVIIRRKDILNYCFKKNLATNKIFQDLDIYKSGHGKYNISKITTGNFINHDDELEENDLAENENKLIPKKDKLYHKTPYYGDLESVIKSEMFYPALITGPSGCGKTFTTEQVCATLGRELIRVNITHETDEDSLMGGFRLVNGNTEFFKGPVIDAMERGAILLLDEYDLGSPTRILCLQSVMEGKGYFLKRTGEMVIPKAGFNVVATANTKGQGDERGTYIGTQILNEAALDRFPITFEADYPTKIQEKHILNKVVNDIQLKIDENDNLVADLVELADSIRTTAKASSDIVYSLSTRRLVDIIRATKVFGNVDKAFALCINRFDEFHKSAFLDKFKLLRAPKQKDAPKKDQPSDFDNQPF